MAFMQRQVTSKRKWIKVDGSNGITFVDAYDAPEVLAKLQDDNNRFSEEEIAESALQYTGESDAEDITEVSVVEGYGARLSAPGYMDCTEWSVYDTEEEAHAALAEEDDQEDEEDSDCECGRPKVDCATHEDEEADHEDRDDYLARLNGFGDDDGQEDEEDEDDNA